MVYSEARFHSFLYILLNCAAIVCLTCSWVAFLFTAVFFTVLCADGEKMNKMKLLVVFMCVAAVVVIFSAATMLYLDEHDGSPTVVTEHVEAR